MAKRKFDFSKMVFDVSKAGDDIMESFPRLKVYKEIEEYEQESVFYETSNTDVKLIGDSMPSIDKVLIYVFLLYDVDSPFQELKNLLERKERCMEEAGFTRIKGKWDDNVIQLLNGESIEKLARWFLFKVQKNRKYNLYVSLERALEDTIENIGTKIQEAEAAKKEGAWKTRYFNCDGAITLLSNIEKLEKDIFQDKDELKELIIEDKQQSVFKPGMAETLSEMVGNK